MGWLVRLAGEAGAGTVALDSLKVV